MGIEKNSGEGSVEEWRNYRIVDAGGGCENGSSSLAGVDARLASEGGNENWV